MWEGRHTKLIRISRILVVSEGTHWYTGNGSEGSVTWALVVNLECENTIDVWESVK